MYDQGADGLNLFNFPCWTEYIAEQPYDWIADLNDPNKIRKPAFYTLINNSHRVPNIDQPTPLPLTVEAGKNAELDLYLPSYAFPVARALFLLAINGSYELFVNGVNLGKPRKVPSGNIFLMFTDQDTLNREPKADICGTFNVPTSFIRERTS
jgi:hypothetical protein